jgi:SPP1 family predicted phage head-tail adaptor
MPRIDSGSLRHRIVVMQNTPYLDATHQPQDDWSVFVSRWARIESTAGGPYWQMSQLRNLSSHIITMRYCAGLTPKDQIVYQGRTFNIVGVVDCEERKIAHEIYVKEVL